MKRAIRSICVSLALVGLTSMISAQQPIPPGRNIPPEAKKAVLEFTNDGQTKLDGHAVRLSAAAQIRGTNNLIVLSQSLHGKYPVRVLLDDSGMLHRAWIIDSNQ